MIVKSKKAIERMRTAGALLAEIFTRVPSQIIAGTTTLSIDTWIASELQKKGMVSRTKGYMGYKHSSCISVNDVVVHGVPYSDIILRTGDLVKVDICASWKGYCADMARSFVVGGELHETVQKFIDVAQEALDEGIEEAVAGNHVHDISARIQAIVESHGYGIVRDFAGHGIGKQMHEDPDVPNFGKAGTGMKLRPGMTMAIEPMITMGDYAVVIDDDSWTVRTKDGSLAMHVEDTVLITNNGPEILTRSGIVT